MRWSGVAAGYFLSSFMSRVPIFQRMTFRPRLELQFNLFLPNTFQFAERLVAAGQILFRPSLFPDTIPGLRLMNEIGIPQMRPRQGDEVGAPCMKNRIDLR